MTVLQINVSANSTSTGRAAENIGRLLIAGGHQSYIAYGRWQKPGSSELIKIGNRLSLLSHLVKTRMFDLHGFGSEKSTTELVRKIKKIDPDIICLHNIHGYYINIEVLFNYLAEANIPVVWTLFDCWGFTGHCSYFDDIDCKRWETACYNCPKKHKYPSSWFLDNSKKNFAAKKRLFCLPENLHLIVHSAWLRSLTERSFLGKNPIHLIPNGIDTDIFRPSTGSIREKYKLADKQIILGCASIWDKRKGYDDFMKLSEKLTNRQIIILVGLSGKQIKNLHPGIIGIDRTENVQELAMLYSSADVYVNPTWQDNFPTTNLEALACGTPVITYNTGGSPEAIDSNTGLVVSKGNIDELYKAVSTVLENGRTYYSNECRERAERYFNYKDRYREYIELFSDLIEKK